MEKYSSKRKKNIVPIGIIIIIVRVFSKLRSNNGKRLRETPVRASVHFVKVHIQSSTSDLLTQPPRLPCRHHTETVNAR